MNEFEELLRSNPWDLYTTVTGWKRASNALEAAWKKASKMATESEARAYMDKVMLKYADFGAMDSEPIHHLDSLIAKKKSSW